MAVCRCRFCGLRITVPLFRLATPETFAAYLSARELATSFERALATIRATSGGDMRRLAETLKRLKL